MDIHKIVEEIGKEMRIAGGMILNADRNVLNVESKEGFANYVTYYDKAVQEHIREALARLMPEAVFVGEEEDMHAQIKEGWSFIVDPIDGTTNFICDLKCSTVSVGLLKDAVPYAGLIYNPYMDELFTAIRGEGACLNGERIHVRQAPLKESLVLFGTAPYYNVRPKTVGMLAWALENTRDVRRMGSAAYDFCLIAAGRAQLFFEYQLQPWDYAAGSLIIEEAGGKITDMHDAPLSFSHGCSVFVSADPEMKVPETLRD